MDERTPVGGRVKVLRLLLWPIAMLPLMAAFVWTGFASHVPQAASERHALGEATMRWDFAALTWLRDEPAHLVARAVHLAVLHVPGATLWWAASVLAVLAVLLAFAILGVARRSFALDGVAQPFVLGLAGLLVASPSFGADWLYGERIGLFLVPMSLLAAIAVLAGRGAFGWRAALVLVLVAAAPLCHGNGLLVFVAVLPMLFDAARRAGSRRPIGWLLALLIVGNLAAVYSMVPVGGLATGGTGLLGRLGGAPVATLRHLLWTTGSAWLDPVPTAEWDAELLGAMSWLLPFVCWRLGDRSETGRQRAAPWWSCVWFGLTMLLLLVERHGSGLSPATLRELGYGAFLLPLGCVGVLAARFGSRLAPVGVGALLVLAAQDWPRGVEALRVARLQVERAELQWQLEPDTVDGELRDLRLRGWAPAADTRFVEGLPAAPNAPRAEKLGGVLDGDTASVRGLVRSSLIGDNVLCIVATTDGAATVLGRTVPEPAHGSRNLPWTITWTTPLAEGARVHVFGYRPRSGTFVALGTRVVAGGKLLTEGG